MSEAVSRSGNIPLGPVESILTGSVVAAVEVLPAASVNVAVTLHVPSPISPIVQLVALPNA